MGKLKYKFKDPTATIFLPGNEKVTASNLTNEKYDELIASNPAHADQFELVSTPETPSKLDKK